MVELYKCCEKLSNSLRIVECEWSGLGKMWLRPKPSSSLLCVGVQLVVRLWKERLVMFLVAKTSGLWFEFFKDVELEWMMKY